MIAGGVIVAAVAVEARPMRGHRRDGGRVLGEPERVQHAGDDVREPQDPTDREGGAHRQHLLREGAAPPDSGKAVDISAKLSAVSTATTPLIANGTTALGPVAWNATPARTRMPPPTIAPTPTPVAPSRLTVRPCRSPPASFTGPGIGDGPGFVLFYPHMARADRFVTVARTHDPVRAEVIRDILAQEDIPATIAGAHHNALLGAAGAFIEILVQVPATAADRAAEIIGAMGDEEQVLVDDSAEARELGRVPHEELAGSAGASPGEGPYRRAPRRREPDRPRLKRVASFLSLVVTFGTGHFYARETASGCVLLVAEVGVFVAGVAHPPFMWALPLLMGIDLFGSLRAVERFNARAPLSSGAQLARTAALSAAALATAVWLVPPVLEALRPEPEIVEPDPTVTDLDPADAFLPRGESGDIRR